MTTPQNAMHPEVYKAPSQQAGAKPRPVRDQGRPLSTQDPGFITDLGMTGPARSVLGIRPEQAINRFLGGLPRRFEPADGPCKLESVAFSIDTDSRRCLQVERLDLRD